MNRFIANYHSLDFFDMQKHSDEKLLCAISEHLMSKYSFVYDHENFTFGSIENITSSSQSGTPYHSEHISEYVAVEIRIERSIWKKSLERNTKFKNNFRRRLKLNNQR